MGWGPFDLTGKVAIVTGGAKGIGFGCCARLKEAGANPLLADLDEGAAAEAATRLVDSPGGETKDAMLSEIDGTIEVVGVATTGRARGWCSRTTGRRGARRRGPTARRLLVVWAMTSFEESCT
ncbi:MAG: SDR family NAD(P)-dependent oxidoreductase [Acidimicrobiales bacterium]|jgi:NAD(P)-dependent dehydrogenase (short-subunit alcohol dehydrogenase family)